MTPEQMNLHFYAGLTPDGPFEIRRRDSSQPVGYVIVDEARNEARARLLVIRYNREAANADRT